MDKIKNIPNCITALRIVGTFCLLFIEPFSAAFFIIYSLAGITDVLDGFIARKTASSTEFGAKLDSAADLVFYAVMILRIFPKLLKKVSLPVWIAVCLIVLVRIAAYVVAVVKYHCFSSLHTYLSKATGFAVFCTPYVYLTSFMGVFTVIVCIVAFASSVEELFTHLTRDTYRSNVKSIFEKEA